MARFQILALDGGGIRGLFSAAVLAKLEEKLCIRIVDHFDLITGTSTGGIIAIGLGLGMRPREILRFYVEGGPRIFRNRFRWRDCYHLFRRKYSGSGLEAALRLGGAFGDKKLGESKSRLVIPAYNLNQDKVRVFKTPHHQRLTTDWQIPAWKVAMATSAAPTFFPVCRQVENARLIDGGVWANNPSVVGIAEAVSLFGCELSNIQVLSVGTTDARVKRSENLDRGGILQWLRRRGIVDILMRGQSVGTNNLAAHLIGAANLVRIDPVVPEVSAIDRMNADDLLAEAEDTALHEGPRIGAQLCDHRAAPYNPLYPGTMEKSA
ncbi:MAG: patatin [Planctomycetes bacterium]|nr:patatin [Planctomycetota bacterium]